MDLQLLELGACPAPPLAARDSGKLSLSGSPSLTHCSSIPQEQPACGQT